MGEVAGMLPGLLSAGLEGSKKGNAEDWVREWVVLVWGVRFAAEVRECWRECRERREWRSIEGAGECARERRVSRRADLRGRARVWEERRAAFVRTGERAARGVALASGMGVIFIFPRE